MQRLDKAASRQRWRELRELWNGYDPIGIMGAADSPSDEYEAYVGPTMRLLEQHAGVDDLVAYLAQVSARMGLDFDRSAAARHSAGFVRWYRDAWRDTHV